MSGWSRVLAIIFGLFIIGVGFTAIFYPAIVVGLLTVLFAIAFIMLGFWALSMGLSGRRMVMKQPPQQNPGQQQPKTDQAQQQGVSSSS